MAKKWIQKAHLKKNRLHEALKIPVGETIPVEKLHAAAKKGGKLAKMANFALNARKFEH